MSTLPVLNHLYTRSEIHEMFGGSTQSYLPMRGGAVVCGCFDPDLNRRAPHEIDVGDGPLIIASARAAVAAQAPIPVFLKVATSQWRFTGQFKPVRFSRSRRDLQASPDRRSDAVAVLFLEAADSPDEFAIPDLELPAALEGRKLLRKHLIRERQPALVAAKKRLAVAAEGALICEACGLRSSDLPTDIGDACFEAHHRIPLARADREIVTRLDDLALLCANCHRMVHRHRPLATIPILRRLLASAGVA